MRKKNRRRKIIIIVLVLLFIAAAVVGGVLLYRHFNKNEVNVFDINELNVGDFGDSSSISGTITNSASQEVTLDPDKEVAKVYVKDGDKVKKGDKLLRYDVTLKELELESSKLNRQALELKINTIKSQIANPRKYLEEEYDTGDEFAEDDMDDDSDSSKSNVRNISGGSLEEDLNNKDKSDSDSKKKKDSDSKKDKDSDRKEDKDSGSKKKKDSGSKKNSDDGEKTDQPEEPEVPKIEITQADINEYVSEKQAELRETELELSKSKLEVSRMERELKNKIVKSTLTGTVQMGSEDTGTYMTIQKEDGLHIKGTLNEYLLNTVKVGDILDGEDYYTGETFQAEIEAISEYPTESNEDMYYDGSSGENVSYYSFHAVITEELEATAGDEVNLTLEKESSEDAIFLEKAFVINENGKNYVYINDKKGKKLKKQQVELGKTVDGSIVEIKGGLTLEDYIAFPYGKDIKEGARTKKADIDKLYE